MSSDQAPDAARNERTPPSHTLAGVLTLLRAGGRDAPGLEAKLNTAFAKHEARLHGYCQRELRGFSGEQVDEVVQEVLLEAWNKLPAYRAEKRFRAFLWAIAARKCANARRKRRDMLTGDGVLEVASLERSVLERLTDEERDRIVEEAALRALTSAEQEVVYLRWVLDHSLQDIASLLGLEDGNAVRVVLQRCKRRMARTIHEILAQRGHGTSFLRPSSG